jgi:hypothetical protein
MKKILEETIKKVTGKDYEISSTEQLDKLHDLLMDLNHPVFGQTNEHHQPHYRGEQYYGWDLKSGIYRNRYYNTQEANDITRKLVLAFESKVVSEYGNDFLRTDMHYEKFGREWDSLLLSQHCGIKTFLTDWTTEAHIALYFATEFSEDPKIENSDAQLWLFFVPESYIVSHTNYGNSPNFYNDHPYEVQQIRMINSPGILDNVLKLTPERNMCNQKGHLLILPSDKNNIPVNEFPECKGLIYKLKISYKNKIIIREKIKNVSKLLKENLMITNKVNGFSNLISQINNSIQIAT